MPEAPDTIERMPVTAAVLAGGRSMRMGVDKTLLAVDGVPLVARVAHVVGGCCTHAVVVTNRPEALADAALPTGVGVLADEVAYLGPLGGLTTAHPRSTTQHLCTPGVRSKSFGMVRAVTSAATSPSARSPGSSSTNPRRVHENTMRPPVARSPRRRWTSRRPTSRGRSAIWH